MYQMLTGYLVLLLVLVVYHNFLDCQSQEAVWPLDLHLLWHDWERGGERERERERGRERERERERVIKKGVTV